MIIRTECYDFTCGTVIVKYLQWSTVLLDKQISRPVTENGLRAKNKQGEEEGEGDRFYSRLLYVVICMHLGEVWIN